MKKKLFFWPGWRNLFWNLLTYGSIYDPRARDVCITANRILESQDGYYIQYLIEDVDSHNNGTNYVESFCYKLNALTIRALQEAMAFKIIPAIMEDVESKERNAFLEEAKKIISDKI